MTAVDKMAFLPLRGHPLPDGGIVAVDSIHSDVVKAGPWAPAKPVVDLHGGDCDLVLIAVPKGYGNAFGQYLSEARMLVMDLDGEAQTS